jgi:hypothetical protein
VVLVEVDQEQYIKVLQVELELMLLEMVKQILALVVEVPTLNLDQVLALVVAEY